MPALTMIVIGYSSGIPNKYGVIGLPAGETADIWFIGRASSRTWKIRRNQGKFTGDYASEERALAALQVEINPLEGIKRDGLTDKVQSSSTWSKRTAS
jgi:hypothetical protein